MGHLYLVQSVDAPTGNRARLLIGSSLFVCCTVMLFAVVVPILLLVLSVPQGVQECIERVAAWRSRRRIAAILYWRGSLRLYDLARAWAPNARDPLLAREERIIRHALRALIRTGAVETDPPAVPDARTARIYQRYALTAQGLALLQPTRRTPRPA